MSGTFSAVIGIAVLVWVIWNQVRVREFTPRRVRIAGILGIVGLVELVSAAGAQPVSATGWALLVTGLVVGAALGLLRAATVHLRVDVTRLVARIARNQLARVPQRGA